MSNPTCVMPECEKPARSSTASLCAMHYHRQYRHGDTSADMRRVRTATPRRYRTVAAKGHPLAGKNGRAYEHRVVLYDAIGPGPHECTWCGRSVEWGVSKGSPEALTVDHLNGDKGDNRPENLTASCGACNVARALSDRRITLVKMGAWSEHDTISRLRDASRRRREAFPTDALASTYAAS